MAFFLQYRDKNATEWMDRPDCDKQRLFNTYRQFEPLNQLLSGWKAIFHETLKPILIRKNDTITILDIGCGGGDIIRFLNRLCQKHDFNVHFTGIEPDLRAHEFIEQFKWPDNVQFLKNRTDELIKQGKTYDIVLSNHLLHHLTERELAQICTHSKKLSKNLVLFNDIERSVVGFGLFAISAPLLFRNSFISRDGRISIRRSYKKDELQKILPAGWKVQRKIPFRLLASYQKSSQ